MEQTANAIKLNVNSIKHQFLTLSLPHPSAHNHPALPPESMHQDSALLLPSAQQVNLLLAAAGGAALTAGFLGKDHK